MYRWPIATVAYAGIIQNYLHFSTAFKEMLETPDSAPNSPKRTAKKDQISKLQADPKQRLGSSLSPLENSVKPVIQSPAKSSKSKDEKKGGSLSSGHKTKIRKALQKFNFLPRGANR